MMKQLINNELHFDGFRNKFGMTGCPEHGRSMVEMLGVLAVIGVLSVAGIAGYSNAMNKHRANELLYQVSMRATGCMAQIAQGRTTLSLDEFGTHNGYSFGATYDTTNKQYTITITPPTGESISQAVCDNMKNAVPSTVTFSPNPCDATNAMVSITYADGMGGSSEEDNGTCPSGTSEENTGGSVSNKVECKCPTNKKWDSSSKTCINDDGSQELYVLGNTDTHYNLTANGAGCPTGYHWASFSEFFKDYNCRSAGQGYPCDISFTFGYSLLRDCAVIDTSNTAQMDTPTLECDNSSYTYTLIPGYGLGPIEKSGNYPALCRR